MRLVDRAHAQHVEHRRRAPAPAPRRESDPAWRPGSPMTAGPTTQRLLAGLQGTAGNTAVRRLVDPSVGDVPSVQRCGAGCGCAGCERDGPAPDTGPAAVQRFGSAEHVRIGNEAQPGRTVLLTGYGRITVGEMIALGDYFGSLTEMAALVGSMGGWGREQIDYALWKVNPVSPSNPTGRPQPAVSASAQEAVNGRYYRLAARNQTHFSTGSAPGQSNREQYVAGHTEAIRAAYFEGLSPLTVRPWNWQAQEAFAQHFLTDAFSGGHIRTPRGEIQRHWDSLYPGFRSNLIQMIACWMASYVNDRDNVGWVQTVDQLTEKIAADVSARGGEKLSSFSIGDLVSKVMHDADNAGLDVVSAQGPGGAAGGPVRWRAVGDDLLFPANPDADATMTQRMVKEAVRLSFEEGNRAYSAGVSGGSGLAALTRPDAFRALPLIPTADPASTANPTYPWAAPSIRALPANIRGLIAAAFTPGHEIRNGLDSMDVPEITRRSGFDLHTGDAWNCFKRALLADPLGMIARIGDGNVCPAGQNNPCP